MSVEVAEASSKGSGDLLEDSRSVSSSGNINVASNSTTNVESTNTNQSTMSSSTLTDPGPFVVTGVPDENVENQTSISITTTAIRNKLSKEFENVDIEDQSGGCGQAFEVTITSTKFNGKSRLARTRMVNALVSEEIKQIHAWTVKCYTLEEMEKKKGL